MIELHKDVFIQLCIAAKKNKDKSKKNDEEKFVDIFKLHESIRKPKPVPKSKPIEDTVEDILHNPEIIKLKKELDTVEEIFCRLKEKGENTDYLMRLESRIIRLKKLLEEQSF